jgi:hypothetical protein
MENKKIDKKGQKENKIQTEDGGLVEDWRKRIGKGKRRKWNKKK